MKSLYNNIESPLPNVALSIDSDTPPFDDSFYDAVISELYGNGGYTPDYLTTPNGSALIGETNRVLMEGVSKGVASITEEPDPAFSAALAQNTFIFSGFKTHQELQEVNSLLHDKDGNLRPFDEFKRDVDKLGKQYNQNYLQAEYNHAVQSAQMAAKWQEFEKHKDFVNLQYRTANDERVRAEHAALHGTTLPVDDPFWNKYLPPLGWNCRCTVVEVLKDSYPESNSDEAVRAGDSATSLPSQKIFRFNPGKELKVFPPKHPYLPKLDKCKTCKLGKNIGLSATGNVWCQTCGALKECQEKYGKIDWTRYKKNKEDYQKYKNDPDYYDVEFNEETGGLKATQNGHNFDKSTGKYEKVVQKAGFHNGNSVIFTAEVGKPDGETYTEGLWDGMSFEIGTSCGTGKGNIKGILKHCKDKNAEIAVVNFKDKSLFSMERLITGIAMYEGQTQYRFKHIIYIVEGKVYYYN